MSNIDRRGLLLGAASVGLLTACGPSYKRASETDVARAFYVAPGPKQIALLSMVSELTGKSEHCGLMMNGRQRVLYDPAGTYDPSLVTGWVAPPRRGDIHYGLTDLALRQYEHFHARLGYFVHVQTLNVGADVADLAIARSEKRGETNFAFCAQSVSWVLGKVPGFTHVGSTMFPERIRKDFAQIDGIVNRYVRENDDGQNYGGGLDSTENGDTAPPRKPEFNRGEG